MFNHFHFLKISIMIILKPTVKDSFTAAAVKTPGIHDGERMKVYLDKEAIK
ncbi:MAG: hypothetical protein ACHQ1H_13840 [Nitrososphaerales archaeon]